MFAPQTPIQQTSVGFGFNTTPQQQQQQQQQQQPPQTPITQGFGATFQSQQQPQSQQTTAPMFGNATFTKTFQSPQTPQTNFFSTQAPSQGAAVTTTPSSGNPNPNNPFIQTGANLPVNSPSTTTTTGLIAPLTQTGNNNNNPAITTTAVASRNPKYADLAKSYPQLKTEIDTIYSNFKKPMREGLDEISKSSGSISDRIAVDLKQIQLGTLEVENELTKLRKETELYRELSKELHRDAQIYGRVGIQQIKVRGGAINSLPYSMNEALPNPFYQKAILKIERRFEACSDEINELSKQMQIVTDTLSTDLVQSVQTGGASTRVGITQIVKQIQNQYTAFMRLASIVAEVHSETEAMKTRFLTILHSRRRNHSSSSGIFEGHTPGGTDQSDPFKAADREDEIKARRLDQKLKAELPPKPAPAPKNIVATGAAPSSTFGQSFNTFSAAQGGFGGGFGVPGAAQGAAPAFGGFGVGAPAQGAAPAFGGGFGVGQQQMPAAAPNAFGALPPVGFGAPAPATASPFGNFGGAGGGAGFGQGFNAAPTVQTKKKNSSKSS